MKWKKGYKYKTKRLNPGFWYENEIITISRIQNNKYTVKTSCYPMGCDTRIPDTHFVEICQSCYSENCPAKKVRNNENQ